MSEATKAVFLSYAREDADAARRIAEALRSQGVEVWFDQAELRGGDAWDAKIKKQIRDCALFMPVVSARTQERHEGYFRREWKLAVERTHDMAAGVAFLVPVVIDETPEGEAAVPEEFMRVQWTRLPGALPTLQFAEQVKRLLVAPRRGGQGTGDSRQWTIDDARRTGASGSAHVGHKGSAKWMLTAVAALVIAGGVYFALRTGAKDGGASSQPASPTPAAQPPTDFAAAKSVAVLAFANLSSDKDNEYFSDGLSENILDKLARNPGLRVMARTSSFSYKDRKVPISQIGRELNVGTIIEGSVQRAGNRLRITAQLINAADGIHVWSETFDREMTDIFAVQDEIALKIAARLQPGAPGAAQEQRPTANLEAYDAYLRGRALQTRAAGNAAEAAILYERAVFLDPKFALAWARLAEARFRFFNSRRDQSPGLVAGTRAAIDRALSANPDLPEALIMRARLYTLVENNYAAARRDLERAESLQPPTAELRLAQAFQAGTAGNKLESVRLMREALSLDPQNGDFTNSVAVVFIDAGNYNEADRLLALAMVIHGPGELLPISNRIRLRLIWRGPEAALRLLEQAPVGQVGVELIRARLLLLLGRLDEARAIVAAKEHELAATTAAGVVSWGLRALEELSLPADLGLDAMARRRADEMRAHAVREYERGNRAPFVRAVLVSAELILGRREAALTELDKWRDDSQRDPSAHVGFRDFNFHATRSYARLGKADEAVALLRDDATHGFHASVSLRYDPDFALIRSDPRFQELMAQQEAWAKAQPDPKDL